MNVLLTAAIEARARGWSIIPVVGKIPALKTWKRWQTERPGTAQLRAWFGPDANPQPTGLAVILGPVSGGLCCRDFDVADGYDRWASLHGDLAGTLPTARTVRGWHVYVRAEGIRTSDLGDGELRGDGGYVLLPPSAHPTGKPYRWTVPPNGTVPSIDPRAVGLCDGENGAHGERGAALRRLRKTEKTEEVGAGIHASTPIENSSLLPASDPARDFDAALLATVPTGTGRRHRAVFRLVRVLKARAEYADLPGNAPGLRAIVREWHRRARPFIGTPDWETTWADFLRGWKRVRYPAGTGRIAEAQAAAESKPAPAWAMDYNRAETRLLASLCRELAAVSAPGPFFLAGGAAAQLLGIDKATAARWLAMFCDEGRLIVTEPGKQGRAARYRYVGDDEQPGGAPHGHAPTPPPVPNVPTVKAAPVPPAPVAAVTVPTAAAEPAPVVSVGERLRALGVRGPNLPALAGAPSLTLAMIDEEAARLATRKGVRNLPAVLYTELCKLVGLTAHNGRAMSGDAARLATVLEAKRRQLGIGGAARPLADGLADVARRVIDNEAE